MVKYWDTASELGSVVSRSVIRLIRDNPTYGWVRGDTLSSDAAREEILRLKNTVDELEAEVSTAAKIDLKIVEKLSGGSDTVELEGTLVVREKDAGPFTQVRYGWNCIANWNEIFAQLSPLLIDEGSTKQISQRLTEFCRDKEWSKLNAWVKKRESEFKNYMIDDTAVDVIIVQFNALGYIESGTKRRPVNDSNVYWKLTLFGQRAMYELRAIRKAEGGSLEAVAASPPTPPTSTGSGA